MKYSIENGLGVIHAENYQESIDLHEMAIGTSKVDSEILEIGAKLVDSTLRTFKKRKHKKHTYRKVCDICGLDFKGGAGLSIHRYKRHGLRSAKSVGRVFVNLPVHETDTATENN